MNYLNMILFSIFLLLLNNNIYAESKPPCYAGYKVLYTGKIDDINFYIANGKVYFIDHKSRCVIKKNK